MRPSRAKIVWGFGRIATLVQGYIRTSTAIPTGDKDGLVAQIDGLVELLRDAETRSHGKIPYTQHQLKRMQSSVSGSRAS